MGQGQIILKRFNGEAKRQKFLGKSLPQGTGPSHSGYNLGKNKLAKTGNQIKLQWGNKSGNAEITRLGKLNQSDETLDKFITLTL